MDAHILAQYQARVGRTDDFWIIGDFAFAKAHDGSRDYIANIFSAIPGRKHLIVGNHDRSWIRELGWSSTSHFHEISVDKRRLTLCHYPLITFPVARHGALQLFGHVHQNWAGSRNSVNVGVDLWEFRPVSVDDIAERAQSLPINPLWDVLEPGCPLGPVSDNSARSAAMSLPTVAIPSAVSE